MVETSATELFSAFRELEDKLLHDGHKLADMEYRNLTSEIALEARVRIQAETGRSDAVSSDPVAIAFDADLRELELLNYPPLDIPLGKISFHKAPSELPAIGMLVPECEERALVSSLMSLFGEHNRAPFGRLLFLVADLTVVPFLGRYGFASYHLPHPVSEVKFRELELIFGLQQVRSLLDGALVWPPESVSE